MSGPRLQCDDPAVAAFRAAARERMARMAARKRALAAPQPIRIRGSVIFEPVTCPRCGDVFSGVRPLLAYSLHRSERCPWLNAAEKAAHDALVTARRNKLASEHARRVYHPRPRTPKPKEIPSEIPPLHTGHELFEQARVARHYWLTAETKLAFPIWEDLLSEGVLALLEDRDPASAMREFVRSQGPRMLSLDAPVWGSDGLPLAEVLAA